MLLMRRKIANWVVVEKQQRKPETELRQVFPALMSLLAQKKQFKLKSGYIFCSFKDFGVQQLKKAK